MIDEIFDRQYQSGRKDLNDGIDWLVARAGGAVADTFNTLHRVQFDAPWARKKAGRLQLKGTAPGETT